MLSVHRVIYQTHLFKHRPGGFEALTYSYFVMRFALGMVDTFGVLFVFQLLDDWKAGLIFAGLFYIVQRLFVILFLVPAGNLVNRIGFRKIMMLALLLASARVYLFIQVTVEELWVLLLAAILGAGYIACYSPAFHGLFLEDNDDGKIGEQAGYLEMIGRLATVVSPFIAGLIIQRSSYEVMFGVGIVLLLVSSVPLFMMSKHKHIKISVSVAEVWKTVVRHKRFGVSVAAMYSSLGIQSIYWSIYMFIIIGSYAAYGSVMSLVMVISSGVIYGMGKIYDQRPLHRLYPIVSMLQAVLWFARFLSITMLGVVTADILSRIMSPVWWMKIRRYELGKGEGMNNVVFAMAHESMVSIGVVLGLSVGLLVMILSDFNWVLMAIPASIGVLLAGFLVRDK